MKFETQFGLGEIVCTRQQQTSHGLYKDALLKVVAIQFALGGDIAYLCRAADTGIIVPMCEAELIGDPDFDQESGYPKDQP